MEDQTHDFNEDNFDYIVENASGANGKSLFLQSPGILNFYHHQKSRTN